MPKQVRTYDIEIVVVGKKRSKSGRGRLGFNISFFGLEKEAARA